MKMNKKEKEKELARDIIGGIVGVILGTIVYNLTGYPIVYFAAGWGVGIGLKYAK